MAQLFEEEKTYPDNRHRENFVFFAYPFAPPIPQDDYCQVIKDLEKELGIRLWYFLDELTSAELMRKVWRAILRSDIAIVDISRGNPNVAFELGLAVATNKPCFTLLKTGEPNPLGGADLSYSERSEYTSVATLKEKLKTILQSKTSACRKAKEVSYHIYDSAKPNSHVDLQLKITEVLKVVYQEKRIKKTRAEAVFGDRAYADAALDRLRAIGVLKMEGQKRGAIYVFTDSWVYHDHEVAGI
jgi:nucleoside 2-deoxyribosyltransferase